ncbi:hypothetical protein [Reyranella sp.]|uniref:hypothetical protein n=1 Tax=Reyranella sp. TaxID=1929291 RepID=UPI003BA92CBF
MANGPRSAPSAGRLLAEALWRMAGTPRAFWPPALVCTAALAIAKFLVLAGGAASGLSALVAAVYVLLLHHWIQQGLIEDPKARTATPPWSFAGFAAGYCVLVVVVSVVLFLFLAPDVFGGTLTVNVLLMSTVSLAAAMALGALAVGGALLFLPASIVDLPWNPGDAWRAAAGARGTLLVLALLSTLVSLLGPALSVLLGLAQAGSGWLPAALQVLSLLLDIAAVFILAHGITRLFLAVTGRQPAEA